MSLAARLPAASFAGRRAMWATLAGMAIGIAYTLSPLSIWFAVGALLVGRALVRNLDESERRLVLLIFAIAIALRLLVIAVLFLSVDHAHTPFGSLFGDEEYFKRRSLWLRSTALDVNISAADRRYAFEEYSDNSYLYVLAFVQVLVGDAPYGVHLFSLLSYLAAAVWLFRFMRRAFGPAPAALGFAGILFLPTLFFWSVSALRESLHFLLVVAALVSAIAAIDSTRWRERVRHLLVLALALFAVRDLRVGSLTIVTGAVVAGLAIYLASRWRGPAVATAGAVALAIALALMPPVQNRVMTTLRETALGHQGHTWTPGVHYKVLDARFYRERTARVMSDMTPAEAARYVARAVVAAAAAPMPWQASTRQLQVYLAEHAVWLAMLVLLPFSIIAALRRHPAAAMIVSAYIALMFGAVALTSGNIGTLVRHRGLILPFVICLTAVGVCDLAARAAARTRKRTVNNGVD